MLRKISTWFDHTEEQPNEQRNIKKCDHQGCFDEGQYKAPKQAQAIANHHDQSQWFWFCKTHVREYNAKWNFYKNMTDNQAYLSYKNDQIWNRPTWPVNHYNQTSFYRNPSIQDPFKIFNAYENNSAPYLTVEQNEALSILEISYPFTSDQLQLAYRQQVKQHHPDIHQTPECEERIRQINLAYQCLKHLIQTS